MGGCSGVAYEVELRSEVRTQSTMVAFSPFCLDLVWGRDETDTKYVYAFVSILCTEESPMHLLETATKTFYIEVVRLSLFKYKIGADLLSGMTHVSKAKEFAERSFKFFCFKNSGFWFGARRSQKSGQNFRWSPTPLGIVTGLMELRGEKYLGR